jgi:hypothetical protein
LKRQAELEPISTRELFFSPAKVNRFALVLILST